MLRVNLESAFRLSRAALRPMLKNRYGRIINVTSVVGVTEIRAKENYVRCKRQELIGFSKALASEVATKINYSELWPRVYSVPMTDVFGRCP